MGGGVEANAAMNWKEEGLNLLGQGEKCAGYVQRQEEVAQVTSLRQSGFPSLFPTAIAAWEGNMESIS